jgi:hypothetical protein
VPSSPRPRRVSPMTCRRSPSISPTRSGCASASVRRTCYRSTGHGGTGEPRRPDGRADRPPGRPSCRRDDVEVGGERTGRATRRWASAGRRLGRHRGLERVRRPPRGESVRRGDGPRGRARPPRLRRHRPRSTAGSRRSGRSSSTRSSPARDPRTRSRRRAAKQGCVPGPAARSVISGRRGPAVAAGSSVRPPAAGVSRPGRRGRLRRRPCHRRGARITARSSASTVGSRWCRLDAASPVHVGRRLGGVVCVAGVYDLIVPRPSPRPMLLDLRADRIQNLTRSEFTRRNTRDVRPIDL